MITPSPEEDRAWGLPVARPGSVTAAAVIMYIFAGLEALACCAVAGLASNASPGTDSQFSDLVGVLILVLIVIALLNAALGYFLWRGRQWARITAIILSAVNIVAGVVELATGGRATVCLGIIINAVIIVLLATGDSTAYFRNPDRG